ncbi:MAG TPA: lasso peptide biosynthesis B2 protein [Gemmatimonadales bacterium]|nr:lasso peptide biosynthesis B2 protein [Gemmatimonadales bacterium]
MTAGLPLAWRLRAAALVLLVPPLVHIMSFARLATWLAGRAPPVPDPALDDSALARWVDRLLRNLPGPWHRTCLKRSAVLYHLLRRAGHPVELYIGVDRSSQPQQGHIAAHAWLVRAGAPYLEAHPEHAASHVVIARFPDLSAAAVPQ